MQSPLRRAQHLLLLITAASTIAAPIVGANEGAIFPDVPSTHWAAGYIRDLVQRGVLRGHSDGNFRPQWSITRAEVAKVALKAAGIPIVTGLPNPYPDLPDAHSLRDAILTLYRDSRPITDGDDPTKVYPDRPATRFETLRTFLDVFGRSPIPGVDPWDPVFPDATTPPQSVYANKAKALGIISGNNGRFLPNAPVTRAEAAKMLTKLIALGVLAGDGAPSTPPTSPPPSTPSGTACATKGGPLPALFPADNWWNQDVSAAPVDRSSASYISFIGASRRLHPDFGGNAGGSDGEIYGMPYASVCGTQPLVPVTYVEYGDESDSGAPGRPTGFPLPSEAKDQNAWIEGGAPGTGSLDGDRHLLVVDRENGFLFELYHARWTGSRWEAGSGAVYNLRTNDRRPEGWTSADAAGLPILPGLVRYDEASGAGITHAIRVTVRSTNGHVWPASHDAGSTSGALPMGARLRLKASVDVDARTADPVARRIFRAFQRYGLIVADNGSDMYVSGAYDTRWDNDVLNPAFGALTASDFEVVQLGWRP